MLNKPNLSYNLYDGDKVFKNAPKDQNNGFKSFKWLIKLITLVITKNKINKWHTQKLLA